MGAFCFLLFLSLLYLLFLLPFLLLDDAAAALGLLFEITSSPEGLVAFFRLFLLDNVFTGSNLSDGIKGKAKRSFTSTESLFCLLTSFFKGPAMYNTSSTISEGLGCQLLLIF